MTKEILKLLIHIIFYPSAGGGTIYEDKEYFPPRQEFTSVVPHRDTHDEYDKNYKTQKHLTKKRNGMKT